MSDRPDVFWGQPKGFWVLSALELWERYTFFGMRAILILYLVAEADGLGLSDATAVAVYGLFAASTYLAGAMGGWIADRFIGARKAVTAGGWLILAGSLVLALSQDPGAFFSGLILIVYGVGLLKPCVSVMVADLYRDTPNSMASAFTLYYVAICIGAALAGIVTPLAAALLGFKAGFAFGAAGVAIGLAQFFLFRQWLRGLGEARRSIGSAVGERGFFGGLVLVSALVAVAPLFEFNFDAGILLNVAIWATAIGGCGYFIVKLRDRKIAGEDRRAIGAIALLCAGCAAFWSCVDLAGSFLTLFADRHTIRDFGAFVIPAGMFQSVNPVLIVVLGPFFAWFWSRLAQSGRMIPLATQFSAALVFVAAGVVVMAWASTHVDAGRMVGPEWLLVTYLLHTIGELLLSPVGLAAVNRIAPAAMASQLTGMWFMAVALGTLLSAQIAALIAAAPANGMAAQLLWVSLAPALAALLMFAASKKLAQLEAPGRS